jgi:hypothetical protein
VAEEESVAAGAEVVVAESVEVVDGLESLLQAKVKPEIAAINSSFFMMCRFICFNKSSNLRNLLNYAARNGHE